MKSRTAILLFSRTASCEAQHKSIVPDERQNQAIVTGLIARTYAVIQKSKLPHFWVSENQQQGLNFGERLYNAAQMVINKGYQQIIILGNDSPELQLGDIQLAAKSIEQGKTVLGRNQRGGAYLIGLQAHQLKESFQDLPWQTPQLFECLQKYLKTISIQYSSPNWTSVEVVVLRQLHDFNQQADFRLLQIVSRGFRLLQSIYWSNRRLFFTDREQFVKVCLLLNFNRRGPPVIA